MATTDAPHQPPVSIRETLTSIIIAFALAFVFRAFVIEAFVIPTGSMAPTLMGAHMRFRSPESGYDWPVDTWDRGAGGSPMPVQGKSSNGKIHVNDPMTGNHQEDNNHRTKTGDRILVIKYHPRFGLGPTRFDAVVFKDPGEPQTNFIKRLIGLPGEQIALVDGDVFVRTPADHPDEPGTTLTWEQPGWQIARKYEAGKGLKSRRGLHLQMSLWQPIYSSEFAPLHPSANTPPFRTPWQGTGGGWDLAGESYHYSGAGTTTLGWDERIRPVVDRNPYNQSREEENASKRGWTLPLKRWREQREEIDAFPVSDLRLRCGIKPDAAGLEVSASIKTRGHVFRARFEGTEVALDVQDSDGTWNLAVATGTMRSPIAPGRVTDVEFWHVDQALHVFVDEKRIVTYEYDWSPSERILNTTGRTLGDILDDTGLLPRVNVLADRRLYQPTKPEISWSFSNGAFTLYRVGLDRDLFYRPTTTDDARAAGWSTHPDTTRTFSSTQYMACGDNSANSSDGRMWTRVDPWVREIDERPGIVPARLMIGKAFFVYFPSMQRGAVPLPSPDFGRLRWIW
jgi:signal peptidase I